LDAGESHWLQKVRQVVQEKGGETIDAGGNHGLQKVKQVVQKIGLHWMQAVRCDIGYRW
jgi:hypothetical protein